ncbi:succinate dehydrogenase cytochrome b560 subunit protein [Apiospora phragmitis]|uniref:Succinate dehydrogenase cytochrome b560 subunit protein n=1 Tax=Apiospora phragmitis TaxID=2905665 RepID=A0ABR1UHN7_9PEZI
MNVSRVGVRALQQEPPSLRHGSQGHQHHPGPPRSAGSGPSRRTCRCTTRRRRGSAARSGTASRAAPSAAACTSSARRTWPPPLFGWHIDSASMAAAFGSLPVAAKGAAKFLLAWPFAFHGINSCRHLTWDTAKGFSKKSVHSGGYAILGASVVSALGMVLFL